MVGVGVAVVGGGGGIVGAIGWTSASVTSMWWSVVRTTYLLRSWT
jgi:hypothetical protein